MDTIRTTISISVDLHEALRLRTIIEKKSLGKLIEEKFRGKNSRYLMRPHCYLALEKNCKLLTFDKQLLKIRNLTIGIDELLKSGDNSY